MSIGAALADARQRAGLTVAQVSERTRIRETVIRGIERDDYSGCGGDFYARGHIRGIAKAVGADPGPLVEEYDAVCRSPEVLSGVSLEELLATSAQAPRRRQLGRSAALALALVVALGFGLYSLAAGPRPPGGCAVGGREAHGGGPAGRARPAGPGTTAEPCDSAAVPGTGSARPDAGPGHRRGASFQRRRPFPAGAQRG